MFSILHKVFGSRMKALEIACVLTDHKPVARQGFYPEELAKVEKFCAANGLFVEKSRNKIVLDDKDTFTNRGRVADATKKVHGMTLAYISKDELKAAQACLAETQGDHYITGLMLGYPECCVRFFAERFAADDLNPVHVPTNVWTNVRLRESDICLLSHFPCTSDCVQSIKIARENWTLLQQIDKECAHEWMKKLAENVKL
ncbi:MAG TPA: hypothetical protein VJB66_04120 [Candidatus Nanoarchaeia archaeon]|nr:hypothetical protein [Candidatus Nanoarchaeia archaeon]